MTLMPNLKAAADAASVSWQQIVGTLDSEIALAIQGETQSLVDAMAVEFPSVTIGTSITDDVSAIAGSVAIGAGTVVTSVNGETGAVTDVAKTTASNAFSQSQAISASGALVVVTDTNPASTVSGLVSLTNDSSVLLVVGASSATDVAQIITFTSSPIIFGVGGVESMRLTAGGELSIGSATADASAILQASSTTQGFLKPRMTSAQRAAIASPATGLTVHDTNYRAPCFYDGIDWRLQPVILVRLPAIEISNEPNEVDILNVTVPGGILATDRQMRVHFGGLVTNNSGGNRTAIFSIYYGTTLMWRDSTPTMTSSANGRGLWLTLLLSNQGVSNSQDVSGQFVLGGVGPTVVGRGDIGSDEITSHAAIDGTAAVDSLVDQDFRVTVDFSGGANANLILNRYRCIVEIL